MGDRLGSMQALVDSAADEARQQIGERIARSLLDVDHFVSLLAQELARSKAAVVRELVRDLAAQVQALRLAISMDRTGEHLLGPVLDLKATSSQLRLICKKSRIGEGSKLAIELVVKLLPQLNRDLQEWDGVPSAPADGISQP